MIYPLKMVIFHSYVSLPEGIGCLQTQGTSNFDALKHEFADQACHKFRYTYILSLCGIFSISLCRGLS